MNMFVFVVPRTPVNMRNDLRDELWELSKKSLIAQNSKNWKAIIIGDTTDDRLDTEFFITLEFDAYTKSEKIQFALDYLKSNASFKPEYLIRFDDDDIFSQTILTEIQQLPNKFDCYFDKYHTYIDAVYLKLSQKKNFWLANTAIHKYEHAITVCGKSNIQLILQDHSEYWHIFYKDKVVYKTKRSKPIYYRVLTPYSITSLKSITKGSIDWVSHLNYLNGYGPWINLPSTHLFFKSLLKVSKFYFSDAPYLKNIFWIFNRIKYVKTLLLNT